MRRGSLIGLIVLILVAGYGPWPSDDATAQSTRFPPGGKPRLRSEWFIQQRAYPGTRIPPQARSKALAYLRQAVASRQMATWPPAGVEIKGHQSSLIGPAPLNNPNNIFYNGTGANAGRLSTIAIHPTDPNIVYLGAAQGGVWKSTDAGQTWTPLTDSQCSLAMGWIAIDPVNPNIIYAGTGEQHFSGDSYYGCGVLRSSDAGATWTQLGASVFDTATGGARISRVVINPATAGSTATTTVFAASTFGLYKSLDSGGTWALKLAGIVTDVLIHPTNPQIMYAAVGAIFGSAANGIYRSTDGGENWTKLTNGLPAADVGRINLAIAPSNPQILYAAIQDSFNGSLADGALLGIWSTADGGASWTQLTATNASCSLGSSHQCWYDMAIAVDPTNPNTVYFGGIWLYKSTNAGATFADISQGVDGRYIHVDQHVLVFDSLQRLYVGNDGGIWRTVDGGATWTNLNGNLAVNQFYPGVALHPSNASVALGGMQDTGTAKYAGTAVWNMVVGGDGVVAAFDRNIPDSRWYASWQYLGLLRTDNNGASFTSIDGGIEKTGVLFIAQFAMDPNNSDVLIAGTNNVWRTTNRGASWTSNSPDFSQGIFVLAFAPSESSTYYVGTAAGEVSVTRNTGSTWTNVSAGLPIRFISDIAVGSTDPQEVYVTVSGFGSGHVFRSTNAGASWTDISGNLPDIPVNTITLLPGTTVPILYVGTDLGVFRSTNGGTTWALLSGLPNVAFGDLAFNRTTALLLAASHGRSVWRLGIQSFADVPVSDWGYGWIERLFERGTTAGCGMTGGERNYCPDNSVTRREMAVFIVRSMGQTQATCTGLFSDVPASDWGCGWIEKLYTLGVTAGCATSPLRYCPDNNVTRREMAVFLNRGAGQTPCLTCGPTFSDVPATDWGYGWIERLYQRGITAGCAVSPLRYCPDNNVTRREMAVFLIRNWP